MACATYATYTYPTRDAPRPPLGSTLAAARAPHAALHEPGSPLPPPPPAGLLAGVPASGRRPVLRPSPSDLLLDSSLHGSSSPAARLSDMGSNQVSIK